ncbi:hypothetical protein IWQ60_003638 [Tieghemiomyces parasiticus]|uniref:Chromatin assembly factor 1 subunit A dimerization domain-containing protein n=1 Tax=Tieghemiomyces parasiticus TaxID=78921 RepID=A0A9W8AAF3_9FUNG|nr:hypothetical protein IWQ60_003638 [Tieghemiomyces parasiticus]
MSTSAERPVFVEFPTHLYALVAALVQDKAQGIDLLALHVRDTLYPTGCLPPSSAAADEIIPLSTLARVINDVAERVNYGLDPSAIPTDSVTPVILPHHHVTLYRWEIRHPAVYFDPEMVTFLAERRMRREAAAQKLAIQFSSLKPEEAEGILQVPSQARRTKKRVRDDPPTDEISKPSPDKTDEATENSDCQIIAAAEDGVIQPPEPVFKKHKPDKEALNSQTKLQGFFVKVAKPEPNTATAAAAVDPTAKDPPSVKSDYERVFRPFYVRPTMSVAPICPSGVRLGPDFDRLVLSGTPVEPDLRRQFDRAAYRRQVLAYERSRLRPCPIVSDPTATTTTAPVAVDDSGWAEARTAAVPIDLEATNEPSQIIIEDEAQPYRLAIFKLLQFTENIRPPYYGTWSKTSRTVTGRRFDRKDTAQLDYEVDSEAEWELDEEGEDLASDDDGELDGDDELETEGGLSGAGPQAGRAAGRGPTGEDEEATGWLVPEGYLSDDEILSDAEDELGGSTKPKLGRRPVQPLVPVILGPCFHAAGLPPSATLRSLAQYRAKPLDGAPWPLVIPRQPATPPPSSPMATTQTPLPLPVRLAANATATNAPESVPSTPSKSAVASTVLADSSATESLSPTVRRKPKPEGTDLLTIATLTHGSAYALPLLIERCHRALPTFSKNQLDHAIKEMAVKEKRDGRTRPHWFVTDATLLSQLPPLLPALPAVTETAESGAGPATTPVSTTPRKVVATKPSATPSTASKGRSLHQASLAAFVETTRKREDGGTVKDDGTEDPPAETNAKLPRTGFIIEIPSSPVQFPPTNLPSALQVTPPDQGRL